MTQIFFSKLKLGQEETKKLVPFKTTRFAWVTDQNLQIYMHDPDDVSSVKREHIRLLSITIPLSSIVQVEPSTDENDIVCIELEVVNAIKSEGGHSLGNRLFFFFQNVEQASMMLDTLKQRDVRIEPQSSDSGTRSPMDIPHGEILRSGGTRYIQAVSRAEKKTKFSDELDTVSTDSGMISSGSLDQDEIALLGHPPSTQPGSRKRKPSRHQLYDRTKDEPEASQSQDLPDIQNLMETILQCTTKNLEETQLRFHLEEQQMLRRLWHQIFGKLRHNTQESERLPNNLAARIASLKMTGANIDKIWTSSKPACEQFSVYLDKCCDAQQENLRMLSTLQKPFPQDSTHKKHRQT